MAYKITDKCINCGACAGACPVTCIAQEGDIHVIDEDELQDAYNSSEITREEYNKVLELKDKLIREIKTGTNKYMNLDINKYLEDF